MAQLRDSNGRIAIDEAEAEAEAKKIEQAKEKLAEARKILDHSKIDSERMNGQTLDALKEVFARLSMDITKGENWCTQTSKYIRTVVKNYQRTDKEYALKIKGGK